MRAGYIDAVSLARIMGAPKPDAVTLQGLERAGFTLIGESKREPLSCRSCGKELGATSHCEECQTYGRES